MYYKNMEAHGAYPGLPTAEISIVKSVAEEATGDKIPSATMQEYLDNVSAGEAASEAVDNMTQGEVVSENPESTLPSPEAIIFAKEIGSVPVHAELESDPYLVSVLDQADAAVDDPTRNGTEPVVTTEHSPRTVTKDELATININLENFSPVVAEETEASVLPTLTPRQEAESIKRTRAVEEVDAILRNSKGVNLVERVKLARAEKQWRADVRAVNKPAMTQEIRNAKLKLDIAEATYGRRGQRVLRRQERKSLTAELNKRRAEGKIGYVQSKFAKMGTYKSAKETVAELSKGMIEKAETAVDTARENRRNFLEQNGRRNNSLRKNYGRVKVRTSTDGYYPGTGYMSGDRQPLSAMYNSEDYVAKRKAERERNEQLRKAREKAAKHKSAKSK